MREVWPAPSWVGFGGSGTPSFPRKSPRSSFPRKRESILLSVLGAPRENRLTSLCISSAFLAAELLSLARARESNQREHALGAAPLAKRAVREGRTGFFHRPSMACGKNRRDPSRRPRAGHAAFPFALRRGFRGVWEREQSKGAGSPLSRGRRILVRGALLLRFCFCGRTAALCSTRVPLGRGEQAEEKSRQRSPAGSRRVRRQYKDVLSANPAACSRSLPGKDARQTATARVPFSLVTLFWASKRK